MVLVSCAGDEPDLSRPSERKPFSQRLNDSNGFKQDKEGNWVPRTDKRSQFEQTGESPYFRGQRKEKEYRVGEYKKTSWWGKKSHDKPSWQSAQGGSRFQTTARQQGKSAMESGSTSRMRGKYRTGRFDTGSANESRNRGIDRIADAETQLARESYQAPEVMGWGKKRNLSRHETRTLLGR